ncbi:MAG: hypothetical protein AAF488_19410 [Planctomycetota bacterium]
MPVRQLVVLALPVLASCSSFLPRDPSQPTAHAKAELEWPVRYPQVLVPIANERVEADDLLGRQAEFELAYHVGRTEAAQPEGLDWDVRYLGVFGQGVVSQDIGREEEGFFKTEYRVALNPHGPDEFEEAKQRDAMHRNGVLTSSILNRMDFELYAGDEPVRGLVILLSSWGGQRREVHFREELLRRGYAVLDSAPPMKSRFRHRPEIEGPEQLAEVAQGIASEFDSRSADAAYGVESILDFFAERHPAYVKGDIFVVGFSAGSLTAPVIGARLGDRIRALVLVGSGAHFVNLSRHSTFGGRPLKITWWGDVTDEDKERLDDLYLEASRLDSYHAATHWQNRPALVINARWDDIVPSANGEILWERLGKPDRYLTPFGHFWLFWRLPAFTDTIIEWMESHSSVGRGAER